MPLWIAGASTSARSGQDLAREAGEVDARVDRGLELVGDRVLDRGVGGDRRDGVDVAVGVEQRDPQPDGDEREHGQPAAEHEQQPRRGGAQPDPAADPALERGVLRPQALDLVLQRCVGHRHRGSSRAATGEGGSSESR